MSKCRPSESTEPNGYFLICLTELLESIVERRFVGADPIRNALPNLVIVGTSGQTVAPDVREPRNRAIRQVGGH